MQQVLEFGRVISVIVLIVNYIRRRRRKDVNIALFTVSRFIVETRAEYTDLMDYWS